MPRFTPYPPAQKVRGRHDLRMVSNVSARRKWLEKYVPEWHGPEIWSEKQVKMYINNIKSKTNPLPMAKRVRIPWAWDCVRIPVFATVVLEEEQSRRYNMRSMRLIQIERLILSTGTYTEDGCYNDFIN